MHWIEQELRIDVANLSEVKLNVGGDSALASPVGSRSPVSTTIANAAATAAGVPPMLVAMALSPSSGSSGAQSSSTRPITEVKKEEVKFAARETDENGKEKVLYPLYICDPRMTRI
jgi:hypothetical protein